jgi:NADH-ubiquinone oxidoreductase chain 1
MLRLSLVLWIWMIVPVEFNILNLLFSTILLLIILRLNVYPLLLRGWASKNKYSIFGALRRIAQTISYEISLALILLSILLYYIRLSFDYFLINKYFCLILFLNPFIFSIWLVSRLAETNRTPFDFSEGERELVSGFNTEYRAGGFAIIFIAEYGRIYFLSIMTSIIFCVFNNYLILSFFYSLTGIYLSLGTNYLPPLSLWFINKFSLKKNFTIYFITFISIN